MKVRDRRLTKSDYRGRLSDARDAHCPCRSCFHPHEFGRIGWDGKFVSDMRCLTRERGGCPEQLPPPVHEVNRGRCRGCGTRRQDIESGIEPRTH